MENKTKNIFDKGAVFNEGLLRAWNELIDKILSCYDPVNQLEYE